ncbi:MAG TPA: tetratricopeptide repeat protein, partial [Pseudomonas sp.]|nr:tetratricopeptide repeat protein [Pseudomonas sp.]
KEDSLHYQLMRARTQLMFEETPGIAAKRFRDMLDKNPKLDAARYGLALAQIKAGRREDARKILTELLTKEPDDLVYNLAMVDLDENANRLADASKRVERLRSLYPDSYPLEQARIDLMLKLNQQQQAEAALDELLKQRGNDPDVWYQVAEVRGLTGNIIGLHQARAEFFALVGDYDQALEQLDLAKRRASSNFPMASRIDARQQELMEEKRALEKMMR